MTFVLLFKGKKCKFTLRVDNPKTDIHFSFVFLGGGIESISVAELAQPKTEKGI